MVYKEQDSKSSITKVGDIEDMKIELVTEKEIYKYTNLRLNHLYIRSIGNTNTHILSVYLGKDKQDRIYFYDLEDINNINTESELQECISTIFKLPIRENYIKVYYILFFNDGICEIKNEVKMPNIKVWYEKNRLLNNKLAKLE